MDLKAKPPHLDKEQDWQEFKFRMKILGGTIDIESEMDEAAATVSDVSEKRLTAKQQAMSRVLYLLLMQNCLSVFPVCVYVLVEKVFVLGKSSVGSLNQNIQVATHNS